MNNKKEMKKPTHKKGEGQRRRRREDQKKRQEQKKKKKSGEKSWEEKIAKKSVCFFCVGLKGVESKQLINELTLKIEFGLFGEG